MKRFFLYASVAIVALSGCKKDKDAEGKSKIYKGEVKTFQHGKAWTWYEVDGNENPQRLAIAIDDEAMNSLDPGVDDGSGHSHVNGLSLKFHPKAAETPFVHALLDWNPHGHEPAGIYDQPHFDFHFYQTSEAERMAIPAYEQAPEKFDILPAADYFPANYIRFPGGIPKMGAHWGDATSPELNGVMFTQTFLFGSYDGKTTFYEPMITEAFIKANPSFERSIPVPSKFQKAGWYPTKMRIENKAGVTSVILENFVRRQAS